MVSALASLKSDYWLSLKIKSDDLDLIYNNLLESETPQTTSELTKVFIIGRIATEKQVLEKQQRQGGEIYLPKEQYTIGQTLVFPAQNWQKGKVINIREAYNPDMPPFNVIDVEFPDEITRSFAANLKDHELNNQETMTIDDPNLDHQYVIEKYGKELQNKLDAALSENPDLVRIAGKWFPRSLLVDVNIGHLNLAEAILEMSEGGPLTTPALLDQIELPTDVNLKLTEFSLNLALQEDQRFDEVGAAGETLWFLERLEPDGVRKQPQQLQYTPIKYDENLLTNEMRALEKRLADEHSTFDIPDVPAEEITISLIYPHWRAGTLPLSDQIKKMFPTAYESPRIRFNLIDGETGNSFPGWVVRSNRYVFGLRDWYQNQGIIPGSMVTIRRGKNAGDVIVQAQRRRPTRDWMRTILIGADGGFVFAMLKQPVACACDERMTIAVPAPEELDHIWETQKYRKCSLEELIILVMRELSKLNPQGHVHAQELYAAINLIRRCPPGPIFSLLASQPSYAHLGDLHFKLTDSVPSGVS